MIFLTTLKQKDLSAVSAEQLLSQTPHAPSRIDRFTLTHIDGDVNDHDLLSIINHSHMFVNPTKHALILAESPWLNRQQLFFHVVRKLPLNLIQYVNYLNLQLDRGHVSHVIQSDVWAFTYPPAHNVSAHELLSDAIVSSPSNHAPFGHPLIHTVSPLSYDEMNKMLGTLSHVNHDAKSLQ